MTSDAQERFTRRILDGLGARPVGHATPGDPGDQDDQAGPQIPVQSPVPAPVPAQSSRIPDWWRRERPQIGAADTAEEPGDQDGEGEELDGDDVETVEDDDTAEEQEPEPEPEPKTSRPRLSWPIEKTPARKKPAGKAAAANGSGDLDTRRKLHRDPRLRWVAFTGSAAAFGHSVGLDEILGAYLPAAEQAAVGTFGLVLAAAGAWAAWRITRFPAVQLVLPYTPIARVLLSVGAAELGRRLAPVPVAYLNHYGTEWGMGPSAISLLITAGGICGGLWYCIDRPLRRRRVHWVVRWMFRIPLASAITAAVMFTTAPVV